MALPRRPTRPAVSDNAVVAWLLFFYVALAVAAILVVQGN